MTTYSNYSSIIKTISDNNYSKPYVISRNNNKLTFILNENNTFYIYECEEYDGLTRSYGIGKINDAYNSIDMYSFLVYPMIWLTHYSFDDTYINVFVEMGEYNTPIDTHFKVILKEEI